MTALGDTLKGAFTVPADTGKFASFLAGMLGSMEAAAEREQTERERELADLDRQRAEEDRRIAEEDRQFDREGDLLGRERTRAEIGRINRQDLPPAGGMTPDQQFDLAKYMIDWTKAQYGTSGYRVNEFGQPRSPEEIAEAEAAIAAERARMEGVLRGGSQAGGSSAGAGGDGSSASAPARPATPEAFEALPVGAFYIDAGDGQLYRKER
ncbi:MAG: hypothetical protein IT545_15795 [Rhodobacteraceae bacterium]|nr:hypothetical protein [Paracoccaceae bacterium]